MKKRNPGLQDDAALVTVRRGDDGEALVMAVVNSARHVPLRSLAIKANNENGLVNMTSAIAAIVRALPKTCTTIELIDAYKWEHQGPGYHYNDRVRFGPLDELFALPQLESMEITATKARDLELETIRAPNLKHFAIRTVEFADADRAPRGLVQTLASASWPSLESFYLPIPQAWRYHNCVHHDTEHPQYRNVRDDEYEAEYLQLDWSEEIGPLLTSLRQLHLRRLGFAAFESARALFRALDKHGLPEPLEELDLSEGGDWRWPDQLQEIVRKLPNLRRLLVRETPLDREHFASLAAEVIHSNPGTRRYRFVETAEYEED